MAKLYSTNVELSDGQRKRLERKEEIRKQKQKKLLGRIGAIVIIAAVVFLLVFLAGRRIYWAVNPIVASTEYSTELADNGFIKGVTAKDYVTLPDYKNVSVAYEDIKYDETKTDTAIKAVVDEHSVLDKTTTAPIESGDTVNIDYVGTVDGVEFSGGNTNGEGEDLIIGSGSYVDDFETELIGHTVGEVVTLDATFPDTYTNNPDLAGKTAVFTVTINGIYQFPTFDDAFVAANLSDIATTVDGYKAYLKAEGEKDNIITWLSNNLPAECTAKDYPTAYLKSLRPVQKYEDQLNYSYANNFYQSYYGSNYYESFEAYVGMLEWKYDAQLLDQVEDRAKACMMYQAILEDNNITVTQDEYLAYLIKDGKTSEDLDSYVDSVGLGYTMQEYVRIKALELVCGYVTVTDRP